jgi:hypothetical protein
MVGIAEDLAGALSDGRCPACGNYYAPIIFVDATTTPPTSDTEDCETCGRLRAAMPEEERPPVQVIEFRDSTRSREEIERQRAIREEHHPGRRATLPFKGRGRCF